MAEGSPPAFDSDSGESRLTPGEGGGGISDSEIVWTISYHGMKDGDPFIAVIIAIISTMRGVKRPFVTATLAYRVFHGVLPNTGQCNATHSTVL